ncbi:MAG TPA: Rne/Rng family ribonuclease [Candidatus Omnitrophota bacterium]|nr:Rne/Rng family ribonuclease [Candidatus Omnitrophota bacterium]HPS37627.1 Rne/Rng family ribonuclease [Candidatus Omnitrophota bacterium]
MDRQILISQDANEKQVAILEDGRLEEFYIERGDSKKLFGNIYEGIVRTVIPGIDAAFVDIGTGKDGFLYVGDALRSPIDLDAEFDDTDETKKEEAAPVEKPAEGPSDVAAAVVPPGVATVNPPPLQGQGERHGGRHGRHGGRGRHGRHGGGHGGHGGHGGGGRQQNFQHQRKPRIEEVLKVGQKVIVQVVKEPIGNKGPRLTTQFSIPARYLVMMPGEEKIGISRRVENRAERDRIRGIFRSLEIPKGVGFIVRTNAEGKSDKEFTRDIRYLLRLWKKIHGMISQKKAPVMIHQELGLVERVVRDYVNEETTKISVDHPEIFKKLKRFISIYMPGDTLNIDFSKEKGSLFERHNIEKEIERTFQKNVYLKSGGHIVIEQTEGLVAIDVNTGKFTGNNKGLEETVYKNNIEAAQEIARQLRLRDIGGIVVIDFIDMEQGQHRRNLFNTFKEAVSKDRAKTHLVQVSELGLIQMTRQRIRPSLESAVYDTCPYCEGKGMVKSNATMAIQVIRELRKALSDSRDRIVNAYVHPDVAERLLQQEKKALRYLEQSTGSRISVYSEPTAHREDVNITFIK